MLGDVAACNGEKDPGRVTIYFPGVMIGEVRGDCGFGDLKVKERKHTRVSKHACLWVDLEI